MGITVGDSHPQSQRRQLELYTYRVEELIKPQVGETRRYLYKHSVSESAHYTMTELYRLKTGRTTAFPVKKILHRESNV